MIEMSVTQFVFGVWAVGVIITALMLAFAATAPTRNIRQDLSGPNRNITIATLAAVVLLWFIAIPWAVLKSDA